MAGQLATAAVAAPAWPINEGDALRRADHRPPGQPQASASLLACLGDQQWWGPRHTKPRAPGGRRRSSRRALLPDGRWRWHMACTCTFQPHTCGAVRRVVCVCAWDTAWDHFWGPRYSRRGRPSGLHVAAYQETRPPAPGLRFFAQLIRACWTCWAFEGVRRRAPPVCTVCLSRPPPPPAPHTRTVYLVYKSPVLRLYRL
jgi:hypothetical protein